MPRIYPLIVNGVEVINPGLKKTLLSNGHLTRMADLEEMQSGAVPKGCTWVVVPRASVRAMNVSPDDWRDLTEEDRNI